MITWGVLRRFGWVGAFLVVVGCTASDGAPPTVSPVRPTSVLTSGASGTATASQTSRPDDAWARVPKAARAHTYAGAQAFAEFYLEQVNNAWTTPDPGILEPYGLSSCKTCEGFMRQAADMKALGQRYASKPATLAAGTWLPESTPSLALISLVWKQEPAAIVDQTGSVVHKAAAMKAVSEYQLRWRGNGWKVAGIHLEGNSK
jgi:hypothetical protein